MKFLAVFFLGAVSALCAGAAWGYWALDKALDSAFTGGRKIDFKPGADLDYELYRQGREVDFQGDDL